jgi:hypothetical protein
MCRACSTQEKMESITSIHEGEVSLIEKVAIL